MDSVYINGVGIISEAACTAEELFQLISGKELTAQGRKLEFASNVPPSKLRRASRYTKLAAAASDLALSDAKIQLTDPYRIGAVISSGFGSVEYFRQFSDQVQAGDPNLCSPSLFSQSVPNSCLGQICMINGIKGAGTMLRGGDPLEYSSLLLKLSKADTVLCGQAEEWSDDLFASFRDRPSAKGSTVCEGAAFVIVGREKSGHTYCGIDRLASVNLGVCPLLAESSDIKENITEALKDLAAPADIVFSAANGTWFDKAEIGAIEEVFPEAVVISPKKMFGDTLGSSYMMSVCLAAAAVRNGAFGGETCRSAIVTGFDMAGNYMTVRLSEAGL